MWTDIISFSFTRLYFVLMDLMYKIAIEILGRIVYMMLGAVIMVILFTNGVI
jgi:hypothetical protein